MPLAAPSANASTRPSPTAAEHVKDDLNTRIRTVLDGGPCEVGVESTVVDGLSSPPAILRPGGITVEQLRQCPGWENVVVGYKDVSENGMKPRAPGMKYRHYSPKATVFLYEVGKGEQDRESFLERAVGYKCVGVIRTKTWPWALGLPVRERGKVRENGTSGLPRASLVNANGPHAPESNLLRSLIQHQIPRAEHLTAGTGSTTLDVWDIHLGAETADVARGLFSALRELDKKGAEAIFVEGIDDKDGDDIAAAVMNRLRKAAQVQM
jgi:L-threonylcarbamoyladenylate synthase